MQWTDEELKRLLKDNPDIEVGGEYVGRFAKGREDVPIARVGGSAPSASNDLVGKLLSQLDILGLPEWTLEYKFHPDRKWHFDIAWPGIGDSAGVAVEVDGGIWMQTSKGFSKGHAHPARFEADMEKINTATVMGWKVLRVGGKHIASGDAAKWIFDLVQGNT